VTASAQSKCHSRQFLRPPRRNCLYHVYVRGEAHLAAGQVSSTAATQFQKVIDHSGIVKASFRFP
jgi:hypothetical protein